MDYSNCQRIENALTAKPGTSTSITISNVMWTRNETESNVFPLFSSKNERWRRDDTLERCLGCFQFIDHLFSAEVQDGLVWTLESSYACIVLVFIGVSEYIYRRCSFTYRFLHLAIVFSFLRVRFVLSHYDLSHPSLTIIFTFFTFVHLHSEVRLELMHHPYAGKICYIGYLASRSGCVYSKWANRVFLFFVLYFQQSFLLLE